MMARGSHQKDGDFWGTTTSFFFPLLGQPFGLFTGVPSSALFQRFPSAMPVRILCSRDLSIQQQ